MAHRVKAALGVVSDVPRDRVERRPYPNRLSPDLNLDVCRRYRQKFRCIFFDSRCTSLKPEELSSPGKSFTPCALCVVFRGRRRHGLDKNRSRFAPEDERAQTQPSPGILL